MLLAVTISFCAAVLGLATLALAPAALAEITVSDAYLRVSRPNAPSAAAFMTIANDGTAPDRLISASSDIAERVELHTHAETEDGVMSMQEVPEGFEIPAGGSHALDRGGDHVMFLGLAGRVEPDSRVTLTLHFELAGELTLEIPVESASAHDAGHGHSHGHGAGHAGH